MKKHLLLLTLLLPAAVAWGESLSPEQALQRVNESNGLRHIKATSDVVAIPAFTLNGNTGKASLYVFNDRTPGYIIVSADDCAYPLLGYSDTETFDPYNIPPQLKVWLDFYASQIEWASKSGKKLAPANASEDNLAAIAPLTKTKWDQGAPYNDDCPLDNGKRSVTGCVATAMAQAMYFHQWPKTGTGSNTYKWNGGEISLNFADVTFDWDAMTLTYDKDSSTAAKAAVAELMYACGVSVDMNYTSDESGASSMSMASALYDHFGYDRSMTFPQRSFYGENEWKMMVYDQLSQGLPVLYCGQSGEGGHQFICDGYDGNNYFHFNWGWSGMSDGYYLLSALDPIEQGIGGSGSDAGFNYDQGILLNMKPAVSGSQTTPLIYCYKGFGVKTNGNVRLGSEVSFDGDYFNFACAEIQGTMGVKLTDPEGEISYIKHDGSVTFKSFDGFADFSVKLPSDLEEGTYTVTPAFLPAGSSEWVDMPCPLSGVQAQTMTVADGMASFTDDITNSVTVTDFQLNSPVYLDEDFSTTFTLTNTGTTEYYGELLLFLVDQNGNKVAPAADITSVDLQAGQSTDITYISKFPTEVSTDDGEYDVTAGSYYLGLYTHFTDRQLYLSQQPVDVNSAPQDTELGIENLTVNGGQEVTSKTDVKFTGTVACQQGYFAGKLKVAVFKANTTETSMEGDTGYVFVGEGETATFEAHVDISSAEGDSFFAVVYADKTQISNRYDFTVNTAGIGEVESGDINIRFDEEGLLVTAPSAIENITIYQIDGTPRARLDGEGRNEIRLSLTELNGGEFIIVARDTEGHSISMPFLR